MKVCVYYPEYNTKHAAILKEFAAGIPNSKFLPLSQYQPSDIAVIFGLVKKSFAPTHAKKTVMNLHHGNRLIVVESAFVLRGDYFAVGFGGIHGAADFRSAGVGPDRWHSMGVKTVPWQRRDEGPIVVCGQLPRDTNVQDTNHVRWCRETVAYYKKLNLPVWFRPHPKSGDGSVYGINDVHIDRWPIKRTLNDARCLVIWNSTSGVDALVAGVPVIACSPTAMAYPVASHSLDPKKLRYPSRREFFNRLGYSQWTPLEMRSGVVWEHLMRDTNVY